jgi:esterase/lipase superfamily enzyme
MIAVLVNGMRDSRYVDSFDGKRPVETVIIKDLIPHIDKTWRTIARRDARAIEGFSMGGFGAARLSFKFPELFGAVSIMAGALLDSESVTASRISPLFEKNFGSSKAYFQANSPWVLAAQNAAAVRGRTSLRILCGDLDALLERNLTYHEMLVRLGVANQFTKVPGVGHNQRLFYEKLGHGAFEFYQRAFVRPSAQNLPRYDIYRAPSPIVIDARLDEPAWQKAPPAGEFHFNRWKQGEKEPTVAKMLWDDENLYVSYFCHDRHISAYVRERHGPVSKDDCVEIFLSPNPDKLANYYTFEINAIGAMLNRCRTDWWKGPPTWEPDGVRYRTSYHGLPAKDESPDDRHWTVEMAIPLRNFAGDAAHTPPRDGDLWRLNLNRTGGITNPQSSTWSPLPAPATSFHTPSAFGWVRFRTQLP